MSPDAECSIIDVQMPGLTGLEVQERMNGNGLDVRSNLIRYIHCRPRRGGDRETRLAGRSRRLSEKADQIEESLVNLILSASLGRRKAGLNWGMDRNLVFVGPGMPRR
jgi:hypothetical protein